MLLNYFLCLALLVGFIDGGAILSKITSSLKKGDKSKNDSKGSVGTNDVIVKATDKPKAATDSKDAPWCQDAIDEWDCEEYKNYGYCNDIYGKHYHMCEKTCTNGTCKSPFL